MSLDMPVRAGAAEAADAAAESEFDSAWIETLVVATVTGFAVVFASSLSVLMYLS